MRGTHLFPGLLAVLLALPAQAAEPRTEEFGDWGFVCTTAESESGEARESCNLFQTALLNATQGEGAEAAGGSQRVLLTRVGYLEGNENPVLLITAPLGILLPMGITVEVEGHDAMRVPVQRCDAGGCLAYVVMEQPLVDAFRKADQAKVTFYDAQRRGATIPLSLSGFTKGMKELQDSRED